MPRKNIQFEMRLTISGSNGMAFYIPSEIVKILDLKEKKNYKMQCILDTDNDIIIYTDQLAAPRDIEDEYEDEEDEEYE